MHNVKSLASKKSHYQFLHAEDIKQELANFKNALNECKSNFIVSTKLILHLHFIGNFL